VSKLVTIIEITKIGQPPENMRNLGAYQRILRRITPYFTKFFVEHGISANQVSVLSTLFGIIGSFLFVFGNYYLMLIGCVFCCFSSIFDLVDGEVARVTNVKTIGGLYLEGFHDPIVESCFLTFFGIGPYRMLENIVFAFFGFIFVLFICLVHIFNKWRKSLREDLEKKEKVYVFPLMKKKSVAGKIYRSVYRRVRVLFLFPHAHLILVCILAFQLLFPIKLSYTTCGVTLNILSTYFFYTGSTGQLEQ